MLLRLREPDGKAMPAKGLPEVCQPTAEGNCEAFTHAPAVQAVVQMARGSPNAQFSPCLTAFVFKILTFDMPRLLFRQARGRRPVAYRARG